ncbi:speckle-type POZ protein [Orussus abietinus]|uniref:speckle-type POZ protein n=1 Tax=Orussus abietinus TaxID=222816 RepID=UPI0006258D3E|nr:speckle-type POZ protein [Orussus abietinus]
MEKRDTVMNSFKELAEFLDDTKYERQLYAHTYSINDIGFILNKLGRTTYKIVLEENCSLTWELKLSCSSGYLEMHLLPQNTITRCRDHLTLCCHFDYESCMKCTSKFAFIRYIITISYRGPGGQDSWTKKIDSNFWMRYSESLFKDMTGYAVPFTEWKSSDVLTVTCKFYVIEEKQSARQERDPFQEPSQHISSVSKYLWKSRQFSDVTLVALNKQFHAHKAVLAANSPVFQKMFESEMQEVTRNTVKITDVEGTLVELMLKFLYLGPIDEVKNKAYELVYLADKYDIKTMKEMCQNVLHTKITPENSVNTLILADKHNLQLLRSSTIRYIVKNVKVIRNRPEFPLLKACPDLLYEILCESTESVTIKGADRHNLENENLPKTSV